MSLPVSGAWWRQSRFRKLMCSFCSGIRDPKPVTSIRVIAREQHLALKHCHIGRNKPRSSVADPGQFVCACRGAIRNPEPVASTSVAATKQCLIFEGGDVERKNTGRRNAGDARKFICSSGGSVSCPKAKLKVRVDPTE